MTVVSRLRQVFHHLTVRRHRLFPALVGTCHRYSGEFSGTTVTLVSLVVRPLPW